MNNRLSMGAVIVGTVVMTFGLTLVAVGLYLTATEGPADPTPTGVLEECPTEDSDNCWWDGGENGKGLKFIVVDGEITYLIPKAS